MIIFFPYQIIVSSMQSILQNLPSSTKLSDLISPFLHYPILLFFTIKLFKRVIVSPILYFDPFLSNFCLRFSTKISHFELNFLSPLFSRFWHRKSFFSSGNSDRKRSCVLFLCACLFFLLPHCHLPDSSAVSALGFTPPSPAFYLCHLHSLPCWSHTGYGWVMSKLVCLTILL